jgi:hypothetical protein
MTYKQYSLMLVLAVIAGFLGGILAAKVFTIQPAYGEKAAEIPKVIAAEQFRVVDTSGRVRARLKETGVDVLYEDGTQGAVLALDEGVPSVALLDRNGTKRAALNLGIDSSPLLSLRDSHGKGGASLRQTGLALFDMNGMSRASLGLDAGSTPEFLFRDSESQAGAVLVLNEGAPQLHLLDKRGIARAGLYLDVDFAPVLDLFDASGRTRAALGSTSLGNMPTEEEVKRPESSLILSEGRF